MGQGGGERGVSCSDVLGMYGGPSIILVDMYSVKKSIQGWRAAELDQVVREMQKSDLRADDVRNQRERLAYANPTDILFSIDIYISK